MSIPFFCVIDDTMMINCIYPKISNQNMQLIHFYQENAFSLDFFINFWNLSRVCKQNNLNVNAIFVVIVWHQFVAISLTTLFIVGLLFLHTQYDFGTWKYHSTYDAPRGTPALCGATLCLPEVKSCRIMWCLVPTEHIVENHCDLLGFKCFQRLL